MSTKKRLSYGRQSKNLDLQPEIKGTARPAEKPDIASSTLPHTLKGYEKTDGVMSYGIICVISGGEKKECDFLCELIHQINLHSLRVVFISKEGQGLQPYQMQEKWEEIQREKIFNISNRNYQLDAADKIFLLTDVDEFYEQLVKIVGNQNGGNMAQWIISNPCFEIWLYYCLRNQPQTELASIALLDTTKRSQEMKRLGNTVIAGGLNPKLAFERMKDGIVHSCEHYAEDNKSIPVLYATQMHKMAQFLIDTMNDNLNEYDVFVRQKQEWRTKMKKHVL